MFKQKCHFWSLTQRMTLKAKSKYLMSGLISLVSRRGRLYLSDLGAAPLEAAGRAIFVNRFRFAYCLFGVFVIVGLFLLCINLFILKIYIKNYVLSRESCKAKFKT